jgi:hypothetical protein
MRTLSWASVAAALGILAALTGCDTNYYGDSGARTSSTTTTTTQPAMVAPPPSATSSTTVTPNPDGSVTTTERSYRRY